FDQVNAVFTGKKAFAETALGATGAGGSVVGAYSAIDTGGLTGVADIGKALSGLGSASSASEFMTGVTNVVGTTASFASTVAGLADTVKSLADLFGKDVPGLS